MPLKSGFVSGQMHGRAFSRRLLCPGLAKGCRKILFPYSSILMRDFAELYVDGQVKRGSVTSSQAI